MNPQEAIRLVQLVIDLIEAHRVEIGERPKTTPVHWKGIDMSFDEAKRVIREFEDLKLEYQKSMNNTQTGGDLTTLATGGAGLTAIVAGIAMLFFPPTAAAGAITILSGAGTIGVGRTVGEGIKKVSTNHGEQNIQQIDTYIDSMKNAIIASV